MKTITNAVPTEDISVRPCQLMCIICRLGAGDSIKRLRDKRLDVIFQAIRKDPRVPLRLCSYEGDKCTGKDHDSPHGVLFHMYQDEAIKTRLKLTGDSVKSGLAGLMDTVASKEGICWFNPESPAAWRGCPLAGRGYYEKGRERLKELAKAMLPAYNSFKTQADMDKIKAQSAADILKSDVIRLFPSHLLFVITSYLQADSFQDVPVMHDNLWEPAEAMRRNPNIPVMLVPDHCMVCPSCRGYDMEGSGLCHIAPFFKNLGDKLKVVGGLSILRTLGLEYYEKIPAWKMLKLARERMSTDHIAFNYDGSPPHNYAFERALHDGLGFLEAFENPRAVLRRVGILLADRRVFRLLPEDERERVKQTLALAKQCFARGKPREAYLALTESAFAHTWKQYMELIPKGYARLPKTIHIEPTVSVADRVLKARFVRTVPAGGLFSSKEAVYLSGFVTMVNRPAIAETGLGVFYDRDHLHVGFICADADVRKLKAEARVGLDLKQIGRRYDRRIDDTILFAVQPDPKAGDTFSFVVNPKGVKLGEHCSVRDGRKVSEWMCESAWRAATRVSSAVWSVELRIPFSVLGINGARGANWRMNAHRFFRNSMLDHHSWPYASWNMDDPDKCGRLVFG